MTESRPPAAQEQTVGKPSVRAVQQETAPASGRREVFDGVNLGLNDADLAHPATAKLLYDSMQLARTQCEELRPYVEKFHAADVRAAVAEAALKPQRALEILVGVCLTAGGALIGRFELGYSIIGAVLVLGAVVAALVGRSKP